MEMVFQVLLLSLGFWMLIKGADWFVDGASGIALRCHIPQLVIGLTVVAMGTSAPEAAISISSACKGSAAITIGNVVGSNILNILIILGFSALITPLAVGKSTVRYELPFLFGMTMLLFVQGLDGIIRFADSMVLIACFAVYVGYLLFMTKRQKQGQKDVEIPVRKKVWQLLLRIILGLVLIIVGSNLTVDAATAIARQIGISERVIGLTIVALGTSLPELFTSISAARKGNADIAIGNIVGSNMFNILFVVGLSAAMVPVPFASSFFLDIGVAGASVLLLLACCLKKNRLTRLHGVLMLLGYSCYFIWLL